MNPNQISMGFESPEIASHTLPEFIGAWSSKKVVQGEIHTVDGRCLVVSVSHISGEDALHLNINGEVHRLARPRWTHPWIFRGGLLASIISDHACGLYPKVWADQEEEFRRRRTEDEKRNRRENKALARQIAREMKERETSTNHKEVKQCSF